MARNRVIIVRGASDTKSVGLLRFVARALNTVFTDFTVEEIVDGHPGIEYSYDPLGNDDGNHEGHDKALIPVSPEDRDSTLFPPVEQRAPLLVHLRCEMHNELLPCLKCGQRS